jgi:hypothetical protein
MLTLTKLLHWPEVKLAKLGGDRTQLAVQKWGETRPTNSTPPVVEPLLKWLSNGPSSFKMLLIFVLHVFAQPSFICEDGL